MNWRDLVKVGDELLDMQYDESVSLGRTSDWWRDLCVRLTDRLGTDGCLTVWSIDHADEAVESCDGHFDRCGDSA